MKRKNARFYISIITEMELLSYPDITSEEEKAIKDLLSKRWIIDISEEIKRITIKLRRKYGIKLPDSIICATALERCSGLITNDKQFKKVEEINVMTLKEFCS